MNELEVAIKAIEKISFLMDKTDIGFTMVHSDALNLAITTMNEKLER